MSKPTKSENVPKAMQKKFDEIVAITEEFSQQHLNEEYAELIRFATAALCRKRPSPLARGRAKTWACGITHAIGMVNFLYDRSREPYISAKDLYQWFGVSSSTGQAKSKLVRDTLNTHQLDPEWSIKSINKDNPLAWMITLESGLTIDVRTAPRHIQELFYQNGLIPFPPDAFESEDTPSRPRASKKRKSKPTKAELNSLYVLNVYLFDGLVTEEFIKTNPVVCRTIEIKGSNTLTDLHDAIFDAFDREEEHLYEFQIGGKGPNDPEAVRYGMKSPFSKPMFGNDSKDAEATRIASLDLSVDDAFGYLFDFGDSWMHQINVMSISENAPKGNYPRATKREGESPPQYPDFEEE
ncbi:plasmid pRiA4b ORF-3 family protein [Baaleninema simplex]|uniref:plasmid pRiA4b ORF-3 family protein n=1 Tax=Baaleninema simplex TaxID=2862350 RepID=UPI00054D0608|nr:plasmid pRiA4b ORF-3 family protein [Baaleninema simplex]